MEAKFTTKSWLYGGFTADKPSREWLVQLSRKLYEALADQSRYLEGLGDSPSEMALDALAEARGEA